jgi:hypothetical protein
MKNSTIIGISVLAVAGTGFYFYSKGKKSTTSNSTVSTSTTPTDDTKLLQDLGVTITPTTPTPYVKPVEGVPLLTSENIQKALLSLNIDQTRGINELASPNYIEAKKLSDELKARGVFVRNKGGYAPPSTVTADNERRLKAYNEKTIEYTKKINALGYKLLPDFGIEKM